MERGDSVMLRCLIMVSFVLLALWPAAAVAERTVVLVTNERCPVTDLSNLQIRKSYLGVAVSVDGHGIRPMRLTVDQELNQVFYQAIVSMSKKSYERRALSLAIKFGTPRPRELSSLEEAFDALQEETCAVIFLWGNDAATYEDGKTIRVLWRG